MKKMFIFFCLIFSVVSCGENTSQEEGPSMMEETESQAMNRADVVSVEVTGDENAYTFKVGIKSPDTGCDQYADWWEVISEEGELIYRRILVHSHVDEQPFIRSGGNVEIVSTQSVYIRAHMNTSGYGNEVYRGSVSEGFNKFDLDVEFAKDLISAEPLPGDCAF